MTLFKRVSKIRLKDSAYATLRHRDLYAQNAIIREFREQVERSGVGQDNETIKGTVYHVKPVLNGKYSVVYELDTKDPSGPDVNIIAIGKFGSKIVKDDDLQKLLRSEGVF